MVALAYAFAPRPIPVETGVAAYAPLRVTVDEKAHTRLREKFTIAAPLAGKLERIVLDPGDRVTPATVIARIHPMAPPLLDPRARAEARARYDAACARVEAARIDLEQAQDEHTFASQELYRIEKAATSSRQELDRARLVEQLAARTERTRSFAHIVAQYDAQAAQAALSQFEGDTNASPAMLQLFSPIEGVVTNVFLRSETVVSAGTPVMEIANLRALEVVAEVLTDDALRLAPGTRVLLQAGETKTGFEGRIRAIEPSAFTRISALGVEEQRVNVLVDIPDTKDSALGDGYRLDARFVLWEDDLVLQVPANALFRQGKTWAVYVVTDGRARLQTVEVGQRNDHQAQLLAGVAEGAVVILYPGDDIRDEIKVEPIGLAPQVLK